MLKYPKKTPHGDLNASKIGRSGGASCIVTWEVLRKSSNETGDHFFDMGQWPPRDISRSHNGSSVIGRWQEGRNMTIKVKKVLKIV